MTLRMHRYPDCLTGLAAFCDVCGEQITKDGYVVWNSADESDCLVVHQGRCDPGGLRYGSSMPLEDEILYLANSVGADLERARKTLRLNAWLS